MATTTARRTTRKSPARQTTVIPQQSAEHAGASRMAGIYSGGDPESPWQGFQNAGPDCYWEVPQPAPARTN
jgi:hypothetical protein